MNRLVIGMFVAVSVGCGPSMKPDHVKTPDDIVAEQEAIAAEEEKKHAGSSGHYDTSGPTDEEQKRQWDQAYAELELRRASRSAETCPESVTEKAPKGRARVTLVFRNDGNVKNASLAEPYTDTVVGKCVLRAMNAVIVKTYEGPEKSLDWEVDLTGAKKSGPVGGESEE